MPWLYKISTWGGSGWRLYKISVLQLQLFSKSKPFQNKSLIKSPFDLAEEKTLVTPSESTTRLEWLWQRFGCEVIHVTRQKQFSRICSRRAEEQQGGKLEKRGGNWSLFLKWVGFGGISMLMGINAQRKQFGSYTHEVCCWDWGERWARWGFEESEVWKRS